MAPSNDSQTALEDLSLVRRVQGGEKRAYEQLVERYQRRVYSIALGMMKDPEIALDISQDAFVKVYKYIDKFKGQATFYTWLYRVTANLCFDALRKQQSQHLDQAPFDEALEVNSEEIEYNPQASLLKKELSAQISAALQQVPEKHRAILILREVEGLSYDEISQALEIPRGTVMSRLFHARVKVQEVLRTYKDSK